MMQAQKTPVIKYGVTCGRNKDDTKTHSPKLVFNLNFDYSRPLDNTLLGHIMLNVNQSDNCLVMGDISEQIQ